MSLSTLTFGCRLNAAESRAMLACATEADLSDALLVNTCAVTAEAVRQARQAIRKAKREEPTRKIVVSGCAAQTEPEKFAAMPEVDLVLGNAEKLRAESYRFATKASSADRTVANQDVVIAGLDPAIHSVPAEHAIDSFGVDARIVLRLDRGTRHDDTGNKLAVPASKKTLVGDIFSPRDITPLADSFTPHASARKVLPRAFVQIQNGCDHRCTFCIIPYGRGNSRSVPADSVVDAVRSLVARGAKEIVLSGVDITSYGAELSGHPKLGALVRKILKHVPELPRLRLSSIDSVEADDALLRALAEEERLMPHLHLSLQSGDDMILKRMKRRHSRADAIRFSERVRKLRPDIVLGADLIAGFPTETDAMFENTLSLIDDCGLTLLHVFPFSARAGTPAARMPQVDPNMMQVRAKSARQAAYSALSARLSDEVGEVRKILVEKPGLGRTEHYLPVALESGVAGDIFSARIEAASGKSLFTQEIRAAA